jgi:hypothetical protein
MSINAIDEVALQGGFAMRNAQLFATFMQAALVDFHLTGFGELLESIDENLNLIENRFGQVGLDMHNYS